MSRITDYDCPTCGDIITVGISHDCRDPYDPPMEDFMPSTHATPSPIREILAPVLARHQMRTVVMDEILSRAPHPDARAELTWWADHEAADAPTLIAAAALLWMEAAGDGTPDKLEKRARDLVADAGEGT